MSDSARSLVISLWAAVAERDWKAIGGFIAEDGIYYDVPVGPAAAARGPQGVVARLRMGLEQLESYTNFEGRMVAEGDTVMYQHSERWEWASGESVVLPFVSVHRVEREKITLWADYWDYRTLADAAPPGWQDALAKGDMSWLYDATGQV